VAEGQIALTLTPCTISELFKMCCVGAIRLVGDWRCGGQVERGFCVSDAGREHSDRAFRPPIDFSAPSRSLAPL
jgi:hypothetical protein